MKKTGVSFLVFTLLLLGGCAISDWQLIQLDQFDSGVQQKKIAPNGVMTLYYFEPEAKNIAPLVVEIILEP